MKSDGTGGGLFRLLARNYLLFTLALMLLAGGVYMLWSYKLEKVYAETDWSGIVSGGALQAGDYASVSRRLSYGSGFAVADKDGRTLYSSADAFAVPLTPGEIECVPSYDAEYFAQTTQLVQDGAVCHLVTLTAADAATVPQEMSVLLDKNYRVLSGGLGDGRKEYTESEFMYLTGKKPEGYELTRCGFTAGDGSRLTALFYRKILSADEYQSMYSSAWRVWLVFVPLYICAAGLFIWWLDRRIRRPLDRLNAAVLAQTEGRRVQASGAEGPEEIRRISESFDRLSGQLEESEQERRRLDESRQKMIADISHDLRTPVTVIAGYADAICDGKVPPEEQEQYLRAIQHKAAELSELINEFHEYGKTGHPEFALHQERADICEFSRQYLAAKYDEVQLAGFALRVGISEKPIFCMIDALQFRRCLDNLISNSLRHNRLGTMLFYDVRAYDGAAHIIVADNGDGIPPERAASIFEPFVVGDEARSGGGSGLGLSIARTIIEKHGGSIELSASPPAGRSTQFVITLPTVK